MKRKTLANCKLSEFMRQVNAMRHAVAGYYNDLDLHAIADKYKETKDTKAYISDILDSMLDENAEKTVEIIGMAAFMTYEESQQMLPSEMMDIVLELVQSLRVMDFFTSVVNLAGKNTVITSLLSKSEK